MNEDRYVICLSITTRFRAVATRTARTNKNLSSVSRNPEFSVNRMEKIKFEIQLVLNELDLDDFTIVCYDGDRSKSYIKILTV